MNKDDGKAKRAMYKGAAYEAMVQQRLKAQAMRILAGDKDAANEVFGGGKVRRVSSTSDYVRMTISLLTTITLFALLINTVLKSNAEDFVEKDALQANITTIIRNGGSLEDIKHEYNRRERHIGGLVKYFRGYPARYDYNVPLSDVLKDIKGTIIKSSVDDTGQGLLMAIANLIDEHQQLDPFDKLEAAQRDHFKNIRQKLGNNYQMVQLETDKLAAELHNKNLLVKEYLSDSTTSLWVSWFALSITIILGVVNIYRTPSRRQLSAQDYIFMDDDAINKEPSDNADTLGEKGTP